ncbi:MAG: ferredoxin [Fibrobacter sp.]|nr:ferredoxin [Fibrobacter sp.]
MKIVIKHEECNRCGVCVSFCPEVFHFDRKGKVTVRYWELPVGLEGDCKKVSEICPQDAIEVINIC